MSCMNGQGYIGNCKYLDYNLTCKPAIAHYQNIYEVLRINLKHSPVVSKEIMYQTGGK